MALSQRTILIIVSTFVALLVILATTSDLILLSSYSALEKADISSHASHISVLIDDKQKQLELTAHEVVEQYGDVHAWRALSARNGTHLFSGNFMRSHSVDVVAAFDASGHQIFTEGYSCDSNEFTPVSADRQSALSLMTAQFLSGSGSAGQGVVNIAGSPLIVALKRVADSRGAFIGVVAVGWFIDNTEMERIFRTSGAVITLHDVKGRVPADVEKAVAALTARGGVYSEVFDNTTIAGYFMLKDFNGQPSFVVRAVEKRILYEHGKATIAYIVAALFLAGSVFCVVMLAFVRSAILTRLQTLTATVRTISETRDISKRLPLSQHNDELLTLATSINSMLDSLESSEQALRESEERHRVLFERAPDAIIIIGLEGDEAGCIVDANQAAADQHGYPLDELCRLKIYDLNTVETNKIANNLFDEIHTGKWVTSEIWHKRKDGSEFPIEIHAGLMKIGGKKYAIGFDRDITQRKIAEEADHLHFEQVRQLNDELSRRARDLAAANNELEAFNYSVSHDMRGPLTRISGYCQLLLDDSPTLEPGVKDYIMRIYEAQQWLDEMIEAMLQLAHVTRMELIPVTVDLSELAEEVLGELARENPGRTVTTSVTPAVTARGDARLLKMVMINLLNNAWKYSSAKEHARIDFGVEQRDSGPVYYVRDNGAGFDMKDAGRLFRVFTRLHDPEEFSGTGIGLATVQRIIFRMGGRIWAEAVPGAGATFYFTLP